VTAFTVPMFDDFMRRSMPTWRPGAPAVVESRRTVVRRRRT